MLLFYSICFTAGGLFVALAAMGGLDGADFDPDADGDFELLDVGDKGNRKRSQPRRSWVWLLPLLSLKFWTFGSCFLGLTGLLLTVTSALSSTSILLLSIGMGIVSGGSVAGGLQLLRRHGANSMLQPEDVIGLSGTVEIPFDGNSRGTVRLSIGGSSIDFTARSDRPVPFQSGETVFVVEIQDNVVWVVPESEVRPQLNA